MASIRVVPRPARTNTLYRDLRIGVVGDQLILEAADGTDIARVTLSDAEQDYVSLRLASGVVDTPPVSRVLIGTDGGAGWPDAVIAAHRAWPFQCGRMSDRWLTTLGATVDLHVRYGSQPHLAVENWQTSPDTIVGLLKRFSALKHVELGNEDSYSYKNGNNVSTMRTKAAAYAKAVKALKLAIDAAGLKVGIIAQADNALWAGSTWVDTMYSEVLNLHDYVYAWTVHPYTAGQEVDRIKLVGTQTFAHGCPWDKPIWLTEWGISSADGATLVVQNDQGRWVPDNYGHPTNLTYNEAGLLIVDTIEEIVARCPTVERIHYYGMASSADGTYEREKNFGYLTHALQPKQPICDALKSLVS